MELAGVTFCFVCSLFT